MKCEDLNEALVDLVDGRLDGAGQRSVERHLEGCESCRALVEDLRSIRAAAFMLDRREPKAETWSKVQAAIAAEPAPKGRLLDMSAARRSFRGTNWPVWLGAAAALILATMIGLLPLMSRPEPAHDDSAEATAADGTEATVESVTAEFEAAEKHYQKAIDDLQTLASKDTGELDPQVASVLQKNLTVIDQAISESREALKAQPANASAQSGLFEGLRTKVALLQQTVELINEMRKGNQAEAGRRVQTLSQ
ncbi:MAG TPA: zf-HC2 domain-containing protein [Vicinamibacterales bacterium]|nr:zf-HC2 domain-containing protein [Vicinamibacterales bacterium]HTH25218.1 zf-HC2 domain-containing protein [Vicinamibacterales bacterium]